MKVQSFQAQPIRVNGLSPRLSSGEPQDTVELSGHSSSSHLLLKACAGAAKGLLGHSFRSPMVATCVGAGLGVVPGALGGAVWGARVGQKVAERQQSDAGLPVLGGMAVGIVGGSVLGAAKSGLQMAATLGITHATGGSPLVAMAAGALFELAL